MLHRQKILFVTLLNFVLPYTTTFGQTRAEIVTAKAFSNESVVLLPSWIEDREKLNTLYIYSLDPERLLHNFRVNAGLPSTAKPLEGWEAPDIGLRGHFTGHYLS